VTVSDIYFLRIVRDWHDVPVGVPVAMVEDMRRRGFIEPARRGTARRWQLTKFGRDALANK
jgi:hypothetical protein